MFGAERSFQDHASAWVAGQRCSSPANDPAVALFVISVESEIRWEPITSESGKNLQRETSKMETSGGWSFIRAITCSIKVVNRGTGKNSSKQLGQSRASHAWDEKANWT